MLAAMEVVEGKKMNIHQAAKHFSVPRKSLENRVKKRVVHGTNPGPAPVLNNEEEDALVEYIRYMARGGFPMTRKIVCAYALAIARKVGKNHASTQHLDQACIGGPIFENAIRSYLYVGLTNWIVEELKMQTNK